MRGSVALATLVTLSAVGGAAFADSFSGSYVGNGREARLEHMTVVQDEFLGEKGWAVVISEKESTSDRPDHDAMFDRLGDAIVVNFIEDGTIVGVQVCHQELEKAGFSSAGTVKAEPFSIEGGVLRAHVSSGGEREFFGDRWLVDLEIEVTLPAE